MKVTALVPYQLDHCAGQRFRIELWAKHLAPRGIEVTFLSFADKQLTDVLSKSGHVAAKAGHMLRCYAGQLQRVRAHARPDLVFIYREAALLGPELLERMAKDWRAPIIYDLDEPLFVPHTGGNNGLFSSLRFPSKVPRLMELADEVFVANQVLGMFTSNYNRKVSLVPMAADMNRYRPGKPDEGSRQVRIGWTGTRTTQVNLTAIEGPLARLAKSHGATMRVIGDVPMTLPDVPVEFFPWTFATEVPQLQECQIGVVPIKPDYWSPWKFNFKTIQMMALGMPVLATPIGSNLEIIRDGENGFLPRTQDEWYERLALLADDPALRRRMGQAARETVQEAFSLDRQVDQLEGVFRSYAS